MTRIASLDGFRAISILLVLFSHCRFLGGFSPSLFNFASRCDVGVNVFFVISGYLITTILLKEYLKTNTVNFKRFFIKRAFRILSVFLLYILFIYCVNQYLKLNISKTDFIHAITFTTNFYQNRNWFLGHFWTLSVEEQFYLFWPLIFIFFRKNLKLVTLLLIAYSCLIRVLVYKYQVDPTISLHSFFSVSDSILVGAFTAILHHEKPEIFNRKAFKNYYLQLLALILFILFAFTSTPRKLPWLSLPLGNTIIAITVMYLILSYIKQQNNIVFRFLNHKVIIHIGILSYSIYIWQQFFFIKEVWIFNKPPINLIIIYFISLASYYFWEKPFINLRNKLLIKKYFTSLKVS